MLLSSWYDTVQMPDPSLVYRLVLVGHYFVWHIRVLRCSDQGPVLP